MTQLHARRENAAPIGENVGARRIAGLFGIAGGLLFFAGDMLMYGHFGAGAAFGDGALAAVRRASIGQLFLGGLVGPLAGCLCAVGFWHVYRNLAVGIGRRVFFALSVLSMAILGAVHVLWVAKGIVARVCQDASAVCTTLKVQLGDYWNAAYYLGVGPAYAACALLAVMIIAGRSAYPRWTVIFSPALSLLVAPFLSYLPAPLGAPLVGGDANLFIAVFFVVSVMTTWRGKAPPSA